MTNHPIPKHLIQKIEAEIAEINAEIDELGKLRCSWVMISCNLKELNQRRRRLQQKLEEASCRLSSLN